MPPRRDHDRRLQRQAPAEHAHRLLESIDVDRLKPAERIAFAHALAALAQADADHLHALARLLPHTALLGDHEHRDRRILAAVIRRRSRVLPPPRGVTDGLEPNGE